MSNEHHSFQITSSALAVVRMLATPKMEAAGSCGGLLPHLHKLSGFTFYKTVDTTLVSARIWSLATRVYQRYITVSYYCKTQ